MLKVVFTVIFEALEEFPANIYLFKVNNRNTRKRCEITQS